VLFRSGVGLVRAQVGEHTGYPAFVLCSHGGGAHVTALYVCENCGVAEERAENAKPSAKAPKGFQIDRSVVEHYGLCAACAA